MAVRVSAEDFDVKVLQSEILPSWNLFDSCIPCKQLSPILGGIEDDYEDKVNVYKVNVNFDAELAEKYAVMASPTILFFKGGEEVSRIRGLVKRNALEEEVGKLL